MEKSPAHTLLADALAKLFPDAKFIAVSREFSDWIRSSLRHSEKEGSTLVKSKIGRAVLLARLAAAKRVYDAKIEALLRQYPDRVLHVTYEELLRDRDGTLSRIFRFLGIGYDEACLHDRYSPNSSFTSPNERTQVLSPIEERWGRGVYAALRFVPREIIDVTLVFRRALGHCYAIPNWFWASKEANFT